MARERHADRADRDVHPDGGGGVQSSQAEAAGLRPDDWKQDATIDSFSALVFNEKQFQLTAAT